jgi:2-polyprenyl-3-methyl-5-hydroxy-6-metoxy-1,4-benzoquinol methylase
MKEEEIRPKKVFEEYLRLAAEDSEIYFSNSVRQPVPCPACGSFGDYVFTKHGFAYEECPACQTLFVSPRPPAADFFNYYQNSASAKYFATTFYKETSEARREKLWKPKAKMVFEVLKNLSADKYEIYDIGGGYGIFAEEYQNLADVAVTIIEPSPDLGEVCRIKKLKVIEEFLENVCPSQLPASQKVFVSFELFEHLHDCEVFLRKLSALMQPGDLFLFTTLSGMGVDIQSLWNKSNSISLQHLNFLNPKSVRLLIERVSLKILRVETPGKLDIDIIFNNKELIKDRFWRNFVLQASLKDRQEWQKIIASSGFSSHMFVICECPRR